MLDNPIHIFVDIGHIREEWYVATYYRSYLIQLHFKIHLIKYLQHDTLYPHRVLVMKSSGSCQGNHFSSLIYQSLKLYSREVSEDFFLIKKIFLKCQHIHVQNSKGLRGVVVEKSPFHTFLLANQCILVEAPNIKNSSVFFEKYTSISKYINFLSPFYYRYKRMENSVLHFAFFFFNRAIDIGDYFLLVYKSFLILF